MITLGIIFEKLAELQPDELQRVLNAPLKKKSLQVSLRDGELDLNYYDGKDFRQEDFLSITVDDHVAYLMCTKFL